MWSFVLIVGINLDYFTKTCKITESCETLVVLNFGKLVEANSLLKKFMFDIAKSFFIKKTKQVEACLFICVVGSKHSIPYQF